MLGSFTTSIINLIFGVLLGSFIPLGIAYLLRFSRKHKFSLKVLLKILLRFVLLFFLFFVLLAFWVTMVDKFGVISSPYGTYGGWLGFGISIGLIGGLILLGYGIRAGIKQRRIQIKEIHPSNNKQPAN